MTSRSSGVGDSRYSISALLLSTAMRNRQTNSVLSPTSTGHPSINPYGDYIRPMYHEGNVVLEVECGGNNGLLYLAKLCQGSKGPCILYRDMWLTPNEFQFISGRETAKDWKRSIRHYGKSMKLLLSKGILAVHPPVCDCTGCRISSPVNRNRLEEKLTPDANNGYCNSAITSTSQTSPGMPVYGYTDYIEEIKELIKTNKGNSLYKAVNPSTRKSNGEKIQKLSTEVKKESRLTSIIDQLLINKTKTLSQPDDKQLGATSGETTETESHPAETPSFSGTVDAKVTSTTAETTSEHCSTERNSELNQPFLRSELLADQQQQSDENQPLEDGEIYHRHSITETDQMGKPDSENLSPANSVRQLERDGDDDDDCLSSEEEEFTKQRTEFQSTIPKESCLESLLCPQSSEDAIAQYSQSTTNYHNKATQEVAIKTERVSPELEIPTCDLPVTYSMANWTRKQFEAWSQNYSEFFRNVTKCSSLQSFPLSFISTLEANLSSVQTMADRQTHSSPPMYGESHSDLNQSSNLLRTSSISQLENYLRAPPKRPYSREHRSDPLDLTMSTTKKPRVEEPMKVELNFFTSLDDSQSCDSKTSGMDLLKPSGTMRCSSVCTQQTCHDQSEAVDITQWSIDDVVQFVTSIESCTDYAEKFREHCIDGTILPLLTEDHLTSHLGMKLGPALKLRTTLAKLIDHCVICMHCIHCHGENQKSDALTDK